MAAITNKRALVLDPNPSNCIKNSVFNLLAASLSFSLLLLNIESISSINIIDVLFDMQF